MIGKKFLARVVKFSFYVSKKNSSKDTVRKFSILFISSRNSIERILAGVFITSLCVTCLEKRFELFLKKLHRIDPFWILNAEKVG